MDLQSFNYSGQKRRETPIDYEIRHQVIEAWKECRPDRESAIHDLLANFKVKKTFVFLLSTKI